MDSLLHLIHSAKVEIFQNGDDVLGEAVAATRSSPRYLIAYLRSGSIRARVNEQEVDAARGCLLLLPPGTLMEYVSRQGMGSELYWWHFKLDIGNAVDLLRLFHLPGVTRMKNTREFEEKAGQFFQKNDQGLTISQLVLRQSRNYELLSMMLGSLFGDQDHLKCSVPVTFLHMLRDVAEYPKADFSLAHMSKKYFLNPTYISNRFKEFYGVTPINLHRQILLAKAKDALQNGLSGVGDIAVELGFGSCQAFTRFFTAKVGVSPTKYRAMTRGPLYG